VDLLHYCNHKNILRLEELHETKNSVYLVMEMLSGGELLDKIMDKKLTKNDDIKKVMGNLLSSLSYLDRKNIMHRDLKPENIILKNKDDLTNICLVDFGLASKVDAKEYIFKRCGTPGFVAPEIINASSDDNIKFSTKVDVFSAGIIFYLL
jgi:serine/threonine protein kinase